MEPTCESSLRHPAGTLLFDPGWDADAARRRSQLPTPPQPQAQDARPTPLFTSANRRADFIAIYPEVDGACERLAFGFAYTLGQWCGDAEWALLELARSARPPRPGPAYDWSMATIPELVEDIIASHHQTLRHELRRLGILISQFVQRHPELDQVDAEGDFARFAAKVVAHLDHEEAVVFPLSVVVEEASRRLDAGHYPQGDVTEAIRFMNSGHDDASASLQAMISMVSALATISRDPDLAVIGDGLRAMQADLAVHVLKEESVLLPAVIFADELIRARARDRLADYQDLAG